MIRTVLDTNVWAVGLLNPSGPPARIVDLTLSGTLTPVVSPKILREYEDVLSRPELTLPVVEVLTVLEYLKLPGTRAIHVDLADLPGVCSDLDDDHCLAAAVAGHAAAIITGNTRHFPSSPWRGIAIASPATFLRSLTLPGR